MSRKLDFYSVSAPYIELIIFVCGKYRRYHSTKETEIAAYISDLRGKGEAVVMFTRRNVTLVPAYVNQCK